MRWSTRLAAVLLPGLLLCYAEPVAARDLGSFPDPLCGRLVARPVPHGRPVTIDARFDDWDLSAMAGFWTIYEAAPYCAHVALMYDARYLYLAAVVSLPNRECGNAAGPDATYDAGDYVQLRVIADPAAPWPVRRGDRALPSRSGAAVTVWRDAGTGADRLLVEYGLDLKQGRALDPPGSAVRIAGDRAGWVVEARVPWSALHAPRGVLPAMPGRSMAAFLRAHWTERARSRALWRPGSAVLGNPTNEPAAWGRIVFAKAATAAASPLAREVGQGDTALFAGRTADALAAYERAWDAAQRSRGLSGDDRLQLDRRRIAALFLRGGTGCADAVAGLGLAMLAAPHSSMERRYAGLAAIYAARDGLLDPAELAALRAAQADARKAARDAPDAGLAYWSAEIAAFPTWLQQIGAAAFAEREGKLDEALRLYSAVLTDYPDAPETAWARAQATRSVALLKRIIASPAPPEGDAGCGFAGVDHTLGGAWQGVLGTEAWVLCGFADGDMCGGPLLLDGAFRYRPRILDPANLLRRWRDAPDYRTRADSDIALQDPAFPSEYVVAIWDDNGEEYSYACGPDLETDLDIPDGAHWLSIPLHFSDPGLHEAHYGLYLFAADGGACLARRVVSPTETPGYVRLLVKGPASYTLVVRRLDSMNAQVQALFLDPAGPSPAASSASVLSALQGKRSLESWAGLESSAPAMTRVAGLCRTWQRLVDGAAPQPLILGESGRRAAPLSGAVRNGWESLASEAEGLLADPALAQDARLAAALVAWIALDNSPLRCGDRDGAFQRCIDLRFPQAAPADAQASGGPKTLRDLAANLRKIERGDLGAIADRRAVELDVAALERSAPSPDAAPQPPTLLILIRIYIQWYTCL